MARVSVNKTRAAMPDIKPDNKKLSRQQARDLDIEIGFLEGVVQRDRNYVEALQLLGDDKAVLAITDDDGWCIVP